MSYFSRVRARYQEVKQAEKEERLLYDYLDVLEEKLDRDPLNAKLCDEYNDITVKWYAAFSKTNTGFRWIYYLTGRHYYTSIVHIDWT